MAADHPGLGGDRTGPGGFGGAKQGLSSSRDRGSNGPSSRRGYRKGMQTKGPEGLERENNNSVIKQPAKEPLTTPKVKDSVVSPGSSASSEIQGTLQERLRKGRRATILANVPEDYTGLGTSLKRPGASRSARLLG